MSFFNLLGVAKNIVSPESTWKEDTYHNTLETVTKVAVIKKKDSQVGGSTLLQRIAQKANQFLSGIKLPPVTVNTNSEVGEGTKPVIYILAAVAALLIFKGRK